MAKGSQLSQLKTALSQAGITGQNNTKKRKRSNAVENDKEKRAAKLEEIHKRLNPFDVKVTKLKHEIGGRKLKGVTGKPAQSKQHGMEQRKKTLLKEHEERGRAGGIVDRRFGENDPTMSLEERMLERFTRERQRSSKGLIFNLEDEDNLTHYGQSLSKMDDFDNVGLGEYDDDDGDEESRSGQIGRDVVSKAHFGGFNEDENEDGQPGRKKSKAEVMAEVIAKSKEHKFRRQAERAQGDDVRHELDNEFAALRDLIYAPESAGTNSTPLGQSKVKSTAPPTGPEVSDPAMKAIVFLEDDDYDQHVRELAFDKRSKPKDRTKTEEEVALEQKEALEKAERKRRKRMLGMDDSDNENEGEGMGKRKHGDDDLGEDYESENEGCGGLGTGLGDEELVDSEGDEEASGDDNEKNEDKPDNDESMSESSHGISGQESEESENEIGDHKELILAARHPTKETEGMTKYKALPFTFPCPSSHEEFMDIVEGVDDKDIPTVVQRIRTLYHTSLAPDNKFKLQVLNNILIDHIITSPPTSRFSLLSSLLPHVIAITRSYPIPSAQYFKDKLFLMYKNLKRGLTRGALDPNARTWPGIPELSLLRVIGIVWPTSDMNHAVVSPARVLMGAYLGLGRVRSLSDLASGAFLCTLFLQFEVLSNRFVPEAVSFLVNTVLHIAPHRYRDVATLPGCFPCPDFRTDLCTPLALNFDNKHVPVCRKANLKLLISSDSTSEQAKADLLGVAFELLGRYAYIYKSLDGFIEMYTPILEILTNIDDEKLIDEHQATAAKLRDTLARLLKFAYQARKPLQLQAHKPIPIATYIPKFEPISSSNYLRAQDPDHEQNEAAKLRRQYKQERKGAIRELRKDARFLAGVVQRKQEEKDKAYKEGMRKVYGSIEGERAEEKAMERVNAKNRRRAGRK